MLKKKKIQIFSNVNNKIQDEEHKLKSSDKNIKYDDTGVTKSQRFSIIEFQTRFDNFSCTFLI